MVWLKNLFLSPLLPKLEDCTVEITRAPPERFSPSSWLYSFATFPFVVAKKIYNTFLLIRFAELREPLSRTISPARCLSSFTSLFAGLRVSSTHAVMKAILQHPRKDPEEGIFDDRENAKTFFPLLKDLYPSEVVDANDFLLTCHKDRVHSYRQPILKFIGPQNISKHTPELEEIVAQTLEIWKNKSSEGKINATELSMIFTTQVVSRLLLGHPGPYDTYKEIAYAVDYLDTYTMKKSWKHPLSKEAVGKYHAALETVRTAIEMAVSTSEKPVLGSLVNTMREEKGMTEFQIKTTLFLMYLGGSGTSASLLSHLLWLLGQHPEYQEEIYQEIREKEGSQFDIATHSDSIHRLFAESIRLFTPAYIIGRQPATDLVCTIKNKKGEELLREKIAKHEIVLSAPTFSGRDPATYENPDTFNPHRYETPPKTFPWLPFGSGKHACPGQWLADAELKLLATALVQKYKITSYPDKEIRSKGYMTLKLAEDVGITLTERTSVSKSP